MVLRYWRSPRKHSDCLLARAGDTLGAIWFAIWGAGRTKNGHRPRADGMSTGPSALDGKNGGPCGFCASRLPRPAAALRASPLATPANRACFGRLDASLRRLWPAAVAGCSSSAWLVGLRSGLSQRSSDSGCSDLCCGQLRGSGGGFSGVPSARSTTRRRQPS